MTVLSVNINKIATLRNSRGQDFPNLLKVAKDIVSYGVKSITVHPRPDQRHITIKDAYEIGNWISTIPSVEYNIEGYPSTEFLKMVCEIKPHQCTLVPDLPKALTSNAGWEFQNNLDKLSKSHQILNSFGVRTSLFLDPFKFTNAELLALKEIKPDRLELYTEAFAREFNTLNRESVIEIYKTVAETLKNNGFELNAGHDLNQNNLNFFLDKIPFIKEVSIGHALIVEALYDGLNKTVINYLNICQSK